MKVFVGIIAYNEEYLIEAVIRSVYDFAHKIIVIDGSPMGPSTDRTAEIVNSIETNSDIKKIKYAGGVFPNKEQQRNKYLEYMIKDRNNWLFCIDADEVWKKEDLLMIKKLMEKVPPEVTAIHFKHIHFWRDFHHYITGGIWDTNILYRINRLVPSCYYKVHNTLADVGGNSLDRRAIWANDWAKKIEPDWKGNIVCYHGGHAQTREKEYYRYLYMARRGDYGFTDEERCQKKARDATNGWFKGEKKGMKEFIGNYPLELAKIINGDGILKTIKSSGAIKGKNYPCKN